MFCFEFFFRCFLPHFTRSLTMQLLLLLTAHALTFPCSSSSSPFHQLKLTETHCRILDRATPPPSTPAEPAAPEAEEEAPVSSHELIIMKGTLRAIISFSFPTLLLYFFFYLQKGDTCTPPLSSVFWTPFLSEFRTQIAFAATNRNVCDSFFSPLSILLVAADPRWLYF